jgi:amidase
MSLNTIKVPSLEQLGEVASELGLTLPEAELAAHQQSLLGAFEAYSRLDRMPDELPPVSYPRLPGRRPAPEENRHGAWYVKTEGCGRRDRQAPGQERGPQGQHLSRWRADDERRLDD